MAQDPRVPPLSRDRIVAAALDLARPARGLDAVTLRRLAAELDVHVTSLYNHVATRDAIVDGMVELLISEANLPGRPRNWEEWVRGFVSAVGALAVAHPGASLRSSADRCRASVRFRRSRSRSPRSLARPVHGRRLQRDQGDDPCSPRHRRRTRPRRSRRHVGNRRRRAARRPLSDMRALADVDDPEEAWASGGGPSSRPAHAGETCEASLVGSRRRSAADVKTAAPILECRETRRKPRALERGMCVRKTSRWGREARDPAPAVQASSPSRAR